MSCNWLYRCDSRPPLREREKLSFDAMPLDPQSCPGLGVKLCTYRRWFSRPADQICAVFWEVPTSTAKLQKILRFRIGSHLLPIEQGRRLRLPCHRRVCRLCHTGALSDERHMLLELVPCSCRSQRQFFSIGCRVLRCHGQACVGQKPAHGQRLHHCLP